MTHKASRPARRRQAEPKVRMKDVAEAARVSVQTVSRVVNSTGAVSGETAARVRAAVEELGYRPNVWARSLASKRNRVVGAVVLGEARHGLGSSVLAVEEAARALDMLTVSTHVAPGDTVGLRLAFDRILGSNALGVVVLGASYDTPDQLGAIWHPLPSVILTTAESGDPRVATVAVDQNLAMHRIVDHLADLGCRRIVHITGDPRWSDARTRADAFVDRVRMRGLDPTVLPGESWESSAGHAVVSDLPAEGLPDAIVASNDSMALGVLKALGERGVRVPEDVKVVGFDDVPEAAFFRPGLTTVRQDFQLLGTTALSQLDEMMNEAEARDVRVEAPLLVRGSTDAERAE